MIGSVRSKLSRIVTPINDHQFLLEGEVDFARFGFQSDQHSLNFADLQGGPFVHIGQDFFGKGIIDHIEKIDSGKEEYIILKITIRENQTKEKT